MPPQRPLPTTPDDVAAFLAKTRVPRKRAMRKLDDVLRRVASAASPLDEIREVWTYGSFARGAAAVGDVDLLVLVDEARDERSFAFDSYYERRRPFADHIAAMGCSGSSFVSVAAEPVFDEARDPASPDRWAAATGRQRKSLVRVAPPRVGHTATGEPLAGPFRLLWARGDGLELARERLRGIAEDPDAGRHERTTTVPLLDDLEPTLGVILSFALAPHIRRGTVSVRAQLLQPNEAPDASRRALEDRYFSPVRKQESVRFLAGSAALSHLAENGVDMRDVSFVSSAVASRPRSPTVFVDFNPFQLYLSVAGGYDSGDRVIHVRPSGRAGPWLAVEVEVIDGKAVRELHNWLSAFGGSRETRHERLLEVLSFPCAS